MADYIPEELRSFGVTSAEVEFSPDGKGHHGVMSNVSENQWKLKVRSSKDQVNPDDIKSLKGAKGTLETFIKI